MGKVLKYIDVNGEMKSIAPSVVVEYMKTWVGTQEEYSKIKEKNPTTFYFITD